MKVLLLLVGILLHVSLQVSAVEMFEGEFILMSCEFPTFDVDQPTVLWTRSDLSPSIVHQRQTDGDELKDQNQLYRGRTFMKPDALETGDLSLNLTKLQVSDTGTYTCTVSTSTEERQVTERELLVKERFPSWAIALLVVLVLLVLVLIVSGALLYHFWKYFMPVPQVVVNSGEKSVLLPWRTPAHLPGDAKVEWKDEYNRTVHVYEKGCDQPEGQAQVYRNRTKMNKNALRTGDLSLTLEHPTDEDTNVYTCTVYGRGGEILKEKEVNLQVKVPQVVVTSGEKSFQLPCRTKVDLPEDAKVEWLDGRDWKVYVYRPGSDQPEDQYWFYRARTQINKDLMKTGDFSLTLDHPTDKDTEIYTCTVYDERKNILMKKQVKVKVKVPQVVVVSSEEESLLLPCRPTDDLPGGVKVEWTDSRDKKVHVFEDGSDQPDVQNVYYKDRTQMDKDPLTTKDFSLTLKYLTDGDSNIYTCTVYDKEEKILMIKQVQLRIKVLHVEVEEGLESVQLPFKTTSDLPEDIKVEWRDKDGKMVHLYMKGSDQPEKQNQCYINRTKMNEDLVKTGDLSLTLIRPTVADRGEYKCIAWTKGKILRWKTFQLIIKAKAQDQPEDQSEDIPLLTRHGSDPGLTGGHQDTQQLR